MKHLGNPWVLLFFYCLLIATFVTVAIYVYAGSLPGGGSTGMTQYRLYL